MSDEQKRILAMVAEGKLTVDEAERLLQALGASSEPSGACDESSPTPTKKPRYLRVLVSDGEGGKDNVNVRIPLQIIRAGVRLGAFLPPGVANHIRQQMGPDFDLDFSNMDPKTIDELIEGLSEFTVNVSEDGKPAVRVFCE